MAAVTPTSIPCRPDAFAELSREILRAGKGVRFRAHGASMWPLVRDGDVLLVQPARPHALRPGDVVLCSSEPGRLLVHRVIAVARRPDGPLFTVQGDAAASPDGALPAAQIFGRVAAIERSGRRMAMDGAVMTLLGRLIALRSRRRWGSHPFYRLAAAALRRLPVFSRYLA